MKTLLVQMPDPTVASFEALRKTLGGAEASTTFIAALALLDLATGIMKEGGKLTFIHADGSSHELTFDDIKDSVSNFSAKKLTNG